MILKVSNFKTVFISGLILMSFFTFTPLSASAEMKNENGSHSMHDQGSHSMHDQGGNSVQSVPEGDISHYTCGMHPEVRVSVEEFEKGNTKCPICFMPLTAVAAASHTASTNPNTISQVEIRLNEIRLAGVKTQTVKPMHLYKNVRAVGRVAYDPQMTIAQDEFVSAIRSYEKAAAGGIAEIAERSLSLVESSKRRLLLLGLSEGQITELQKNKEVQTNLILPGDKMWIYGDVYEYELPWIKEGVYLTVRPLSLPGEEFYGKVVSINPVVDPQTRSVRFRALVENSEQKLKPEMYVDIEITSQYFDPEGNPDVLAIPKSAFLNTGRRRIVWVDKGNGRYEGRKVELGPEAIDHSNDRNKFYPVLSGLEEGELVVTRGNFLIDSQSQITGVASSVYSGALESDSTSGKETAGQSPHTGHNH